jgi:hypothetical protein
MLDHHGKQLDLYLAPGEIVLAMSEGWLRRRCTLLAHQHFDPSPGDSGLIETLSRILAPGGLSGLSVNVMVDDSLVRVWRVEVPDNAGKAGDFDAAVAMRFQEVFDDNPDDWLLRADYRASGSFVACALRRTWVNALCRGLAAQRLSLRSLQPVFVAQWNRWARELASCAWLGIGAGGGLSLCIAADGDLVQMRRIMVSPAMRTDETWLAPAVRREADRLALPLPERLFLCGDARGAWLAGGKGGVSCSVLGLTGGAPSLLGVMP